MPRGVIALVAASSRGRVPGYGHGCATQGAHDAQRPLRRQQLGRHRRRRRPAHVQAHRADQHHPGHRASGWPRSQSDPERLRLLPRHPRAVGEGHDQYVDDMFSSHDGRCSTSRGRASPTSWRSDLRTREIVWRTQVDGNRADHMAISPDGKRLLVSASTAQGRRRDRHADGRDHRSHSRRGDRRTRTTSRSDGKLIFHASIGTVYTPPTSRLSTRRRASASSRSSTRAARRSCKRSTWARSSTRSATRT